MDVCSLDSLLNREKLFHPRVVKADYHGGGGRIVWMVEKRICAWGFLGEEKKAGKEFQK
jgi:hypothetical protein